MHRDLLHDLIVFRCFLDLLTVAAILLLPTGISFSTSSVHCGVFMWSVSQRASHINLTSAIFWRWILLHKHIFCLEIKILHFLRHHLPPSSRQICMRLIMCHGIGEVFTAVCVGRSLGTCMFWRVNWGSNADSNDKTRSTICRYFLSTRPTKM